MSMIISQSNTSSTRNSDAAIVDSAQTVEKWFINDMNTKKNGS